MADGCVYMPQQKQPVIRLGLAASDMDHIEKFRRFVGSTSTIYRWTTTRPSGKVLVPGSFEGAALSLSSAQMAVDLRRFGVVPRKTASAEATEVVAMNRHFWRGVMDGDGHLGVYGKGRGRRLGRNGLAYGRTIGIYGSRQLVGQFRAFLVANGIPVEAKVIPTNGETCHRLTLKGTIADKTAHLLYDDCKTYLSRKMVAAVQTFRVCNPTG